LRSKRQKITYLDSQVSCCDSREEPILTNRQWRRHIKNGRKWVAFFSLGATTSKRSFASTAPNYLSFVIYLMLITFANKHDYSKLEVRGGRPPFLTRVTTSRNAELGITSKARSVTFERGNATQKLGKIWKHLTLSVQQRNLPKELSMREKLPTSTGQSRSSRAIL
jgi:hypothetical protein